MNYPKSGFRDKPIFYGILVFAIMFLLTTPPVHAGGGTGPYITFSGSINVFEDMDLSNQNSTLGAILTAVGASLETDTGLGFNHSLGYKFGQSFSTELEFSFRKGNFATGTSSVGKTAVDGDMDSKSLLLNAIYHFDFSQSFSPYIGYGIGVTFHEATLDGFDDGEQRTFAYQFKMGVDLEFSQNMALVMGYRFFATDDPDFGFFTGEVATHSLEAGIKYFF